MEAKSSFSKPGNAEKVIRSPFRAYEYSDFSIQQKARLVYYLSFSMIGLLTVLLIYTVYLQLTSPLYGKLYFPVLIAESTILLIIILCHIILIKGYFRIAVHLLLISTMAITWIGMLVDKGDALSRLDSVVFILGLLTTLPLLIENCNKTILIYIIINLGALFTFTGITRKRLLLPDSTVIDYLADTSVTFVFIGLVGYFSSRINKQSLEKALSDLKSRINAEKALYHSERRFKDLADLLPQTIFETDINGNITYSNKSGINLFGYSEEEFGNGLNILSFLSESDRERAQANFKLLLKEELNPDNIYTGQKKDGSYIPMQIYARPIIENENITGIRGIVFDISERIEAEKSLRKSVQKYRVLFENAQIGIYQTTPDGRILNVNPAILEMTGYGSFEEMKEINLESEVYCSNRAEFKAMIEKEGYVKNFETQWVIKNRKVLNIIENASAVRDRNGEILYYDGFVENITERKKSENELKQSEERYRIMIESFPEMIIMTSTDGRLIFNNTPFEKITGLILSDYPELNLFLHIPDEDKPFIRDKVDELLSSSRTHTDIIETRFIDKWGKVHWFSGVFSKIIMSNTVVLQCIARDITEKKRIESELERHRNNLELLVVERTEEFEAINEELRSTNEELFYQRQELGEALVNLQNAQNKLIHSEKMASIGVLAAGVAHEINNPLNFIQGGILGIEDYFKDNLQEHIPNVLPLIEAIKTGITRSANIVSSLNHYSIKDELVYSDCDLNFIIDNCLTIMNNQLMHKVDIQKIYTDTPYSFKGNEGKLHQAFLNIISNAAHSIEKNGKIMITTIAEDNYISVTIEDSGCGISEANMNKIFDPFFTTKGHGNGVGLGLSITYNIIKEHNGSIDYKSKEGEGTRVVVKLPIKRT